MRKIIWGILILGILCSGCKSRDFEMDWDKIFSQETSSDNPIYINKEERSKLLRDAMLGSTNVVSENTVLDMKEILSGCSGFYCVDIDHDRENEIVLQSMGEDQEYLYLDFVINEVVLKKIHISIEGLKINQKGYFQKIVYYDDEIIYAMICDKDEEEVKFDYIQCVHNESIISDGECERLINSFGAGLASCYEITAENIAQNIDIALDAVSTGAMKLIEGDTKECFVAGLSLMQKALLDEVQVYDTVRGEMTKVSYIPEHMLNGTIYYCDLDRDGVGEIIMEGITDYSILHIIDDTVYAYHADRYTFSSIYEDGSIYSSNRTMYGIFEIVKEFTKSEMIIDTVYEYYNGDWYKEYNYDGDSIKLTNEECLQISEQYKKIPANKYKNNMLTILDVVK